jgi:signal-transduction protein with cAMP-binding, CBS, and nucleotidyltransferase domain
MKKNIKKLESGDIKTLSKECQVLTFPQDFNLVYENQIPNTGVALIDGELELTKKSKVLEKVSPGSILGINQMLNEEQVELGCRVKKDSKIILLGKSDILEILKNPHSKLFHLVKKHFGLKNE